MTSKYYSALCSEPACATKSRITHLESWILKATTALGLDNLRAMCANYFHNAPTTLKRLLGLCELREGQLPHLTSPKKRFGDDVQPGESDPNDLEAMPHGLNPWIDKNKPLYITIGC